MERIRKLAFEDLFNAIPCYVVVIDRDHEIIGTNMIVKQHFGSHEGKKCYELFKRRTEPCEDCACEFTFEDRLIRSYESRTITPDGRELMLLVTSRPITDETGRVIAIMEVSTDITEIKRLQLALEEEQEKRQTALRRVRQLFDEVPCYISVIDRSYTILETNRQFKEAIGDVPGARCYELFKRRESPCPACPVTETFEDGKPHSYESTILAPSGKELDVVIRSAPIVSLDGEVRRVMEMAVDVTEVKDLQRELARLGKMAAHAAHNIKGILTGLKGGIFMVNEGRKRGDDPVVERGWEMVQHNVDRIATQSLDILSFAKRRHPERRRVELSELFRETLDGARPRAFAAGVALESTVEPGAERLDVDPRLLGQAMTVLVDNAIEACMDEGSGREHRVSVEARAEDGSIRIDVRDNGVGMDEEVRAHIFEDFFSTKGSMGTGLGLVVVSKIAKEHGGTIDFESKPGAGTTFTIRLPINSAPPTGEAQER
jgi:PAS domain S-box-containing protein